jgi:type VI secretion system secreted protein VgrG
MPSPKSGKPGQLVSPAAPRTAQDADDADPGEVDRIKAEQQALASGKYGEIPVRAHKPDDVQDAESDSLENPPDEPAKHWIAIKLTDADGVPVAGEKYQVTLPDGSVSAGTLDANGKARIDGISKAGECQITFPGLPGQSWEPG